MRFVCLDYIYMLYKHYLMSEYYAKINHIKGTNLYISDKFGVCDLKQLEKNNIHDVMCVTTDVMDEFSGIKYHYIPMWDDPGFDIIKTFDKAFPIIDKLILKNKNIVINCRVGMSRSAAVIIGYLIYKKMSYEDAYNLLKSCRDIIKPNKGFIDQLKKYERIINGI